MIRDLSVQEFASLAEAKKAGAAVISYGMFLNSIISFLMVAFAMFLLEKSVNRIRRKQEAPADVKDCPFCLPSIPVGTTRSPNAQTSKNRAIAVRQ